MAKTNRRQHGEGALFQRSDGRWVARVDLGWRAGKERRREFYGRTPEAALKKRRDWLRDHDAGFVPPKGRAPTMGDWLRHWGIYVAQPRVRPTTWYNGYRSKLEHHIIPFFDKTRLTNLEVDEDLIEEFHAYLREKGLSDSSITSIHRILSSALKTAVRRGRLMRNPASEVSPPQVEQMELHPPTMDEVEEILETVARRRNGARWVVALAAGPRQGEALGLMWPYVDIRDPKRATLTIEWELARLPWQHGCADPHACGNRRKVEKGAGKNGGDKIRPPYHRFACPPDCTLEGRHREHHLPCRGEPCTVHVHDPDCKSSCRKVSHLCPCPADCTGHASACPQREAGGHIIQRPKSTKSRRTFRIPEAVALALRRHKAAQAAERLALGPDWEGWGHEPHTADCPEGCTRHCGRPTKRRERLCPDCHKPATKDALVFTQPNGRPIDKRRDHDEWKALLSELDLDDYRIHDGRHGAATRLLEEGTDVRVVQHILGHSSPDFTRRVYQHVTDRLQDQAATAMERGLGSFADTQFDTSEGAEHGTAWH